ncbi:hypothetical protein Bpfe_028016 [Biomphalaria pfeifferi]|uniref:Integrase zinc-binding domain-containing protein n=1 Tax=Biomphalaria pfeifferi TaxID=112525 RepID=A0AAD8AUA0_BIOPF|nr:hypothetical protein Bpfe_028016 [Biomphalaria pfeifferi]
MVEQLRECMTPDLRIFIDESSVTTPQEIVSYSDRFLAAHREQKPKASDQTPREEKQAISPTPKTLLITKMIRARYRQRRCNKRPLIRPHTRLSLRLLGNSKKPALPTTSILNATPSAVPPSEPVIAASVTTRAQTPDESPEEVPNTLPKEYREAQRNDPSLSRLFAIVDEGRPQTGKSIFFCKAGLLYRRHGNKDCGRSQVVVPKQFRTQVLQTGHSSSLSAHQGQGATISRISYYYFWPGMANDIRWYVAFCPQCQRMSPRCHVLPVPLGKTPFKRVSVDIVGPLPRTKKRNAYILCVVCEASRWPENRSQFTGEFNEGSL